MSVAIEIKKLLDLTVGVPLVRCLRIIDALRGRSRASRGPVRRVLFIKLWGVGNLAMILPLVRATRERFPDARIDFLSLAANQTFLEACGWIDRRILFSPHGVLRPFLSLVALAFRLRRQRYDVILDFEQFLRSSAIITRLAAPAFSVGFRTPRQARDGLYDSEVPHDDTRHMALVFGDIVRAIDVSTDGIPPLMVPRSADARDRVTDLVRAWQRGDRPLVALHVGSGDNFPGRRWPIESFARLADHLVRACNALVVFTGSPAEQGLVSDCQSRMSRESIDLTGMFDLVEFVEFLGLVDLLVTNDTAPVHLGSALGIPMVAIYGPNSPALYGPLSPNARVFHRGLSCSPCITNINAKTSFCRNHLCVRTIDPVAVTAAALSLLYPSVPARSEPRKSELS